MIGLDGVHLGPSLSTRILDVQIHIGERLIDLSVEIRINYVVVGVPTTCHVSGCCETGDGGELRTLASTLDTIGRNSDRLAVMESLAVLHADALVGKVLEGCHNSSESCSLDADIDAVR